MKGIIFAGCSFTWGEGLELYSNLDTINWDSIKKFGYHFSGLSYFMPKSHIKYIESNRFPRLVSSHFNTFDIVAEKNGGSLKTILSHIKKNLIEYENDIGCIIVQITSLERDVFPHDNCKNSCCEHRLRSLLNGYYSHESNTSSDELIKYQRDLLIQLYGNSDNAEKELVNKSSIHFSNFIKELIKIKTESDIPIYFIGSWSSDFQNFEENKSKFKEEYEFYFSNLIPIKYKEDVFNTLFELMEREKTKISDDMLFTYNHHPSKNAHKIISNSIINFLKNKGFS